MIQAQTTTLAPTDTRPVEPASRLSGGVVPVIVILIIVIAVTMRRRRQH